MSLVSLNLYDPLLYGNGGLGNYTAIFAKTWRRSIRRRGGYYIGTVDLTQAELTRKEMDEFFRYRLMAEIREVGGGQMTWQGALMKMEYTRGNQLMTIDMTRMSNAVRIIYTRIFNNLLVNGSGETGAWTACNGVGGTTGAATVTQDTTWRSDGTYSIKIVSPGGIEGAWVQQTVTIVAGQSYVITGSLNLVSGSFRISCNRADNDQSLCFFSTRGGGAGDYTVNMLIPATNNYEGNVDLRITSEGGSGTIYADGFNFSIAPIPNVTTKWYEDARSAVVYGRKEISLLEVGKTTEAANAEAESYLNRWGWPQPYPPNNYTTRSQAESEAGDKLRLTFAGYWATLNWYNVPMSVSTGTSSALIQALVNLQSSYIVTGSIEANATNYAIDNRGTLLAGDTIKDICGDGKAGGQLYEAGVYENRLFRYLSVTPDLTYHLRGGDLYSVSGALYEPWLARPGYALWQDIPLGPGTLANPQNDPRWTYLEEVEMLPSGQLTFNLEPTV